MPSVKCPITGCGYATEDCDVAIVVQLLRLHEAIHAQPQTARATLPAAKVEKVKRPSISPSGTSEEWSYFKIRWTEYVDATGITGKDLVIQLLECCDEELRKDLTRSAGESLTTQDEQSVLNAIQQLAVRVENVMVARVTLHNMSQDREEAVRPFCARLKGQANVCKFNVECPRCKTDVNYTNQIVHDCIIRGISDDDIRLDVLGNSNQNMDLSELVTYVESKEAGKRSISRLASTQGVDAARSSYTRQRATPNTRTIAKCSHCGNTGHGDGSDPLTRRDECPAYGRTCTTCNRNHHLSSVCKTKRKWHKNATPASTPSTATIADNQGATFDSLSTVQSDSTFGLHSVVLDHHLYNNMCDRWFRQPSKVQPFVTLRVSTHNADYQSLGFTMTSPPSSCTIQGMADTGCQSCLCGLQTIKKLGITDIKDLIPVTMRMHAANKGSIKILGATIVRISGISKSGEQLQTRQLLYVTDSADKLFISREACASLGIISEGFPTIGETASLEENTTSTTCECPRRKLPSGLPTTLPFPPTEENVPKLTQYLLDYYSSSTFNVCEHQPLPLMEGPPMKLMVEEDATPVAHHTPVPVPLHWREQVKADIDRDVRLGVLEPVPVGEPVTWCHRMVVCSKKNGKPRRTVDFQPLNKFATRETHHTQSPFQQARVVPHDMKKTVFDAWNGYHSVPIRKEDYHLTTFITPWGRYRYKTAPQGYIASGDGYTRRYDEIVAHIKNKTKCIDDTLIWAPTIEDSFFRAVEWLDICGKNGITLNPEKFVFAQNDVEFAGFEITNNSVRPCQKYLNAIRNFPQPKNITDIRSWFGVVNQVSYTFSMTDRMLPFRKLLKPGTPFQWDAQMQSLFDESKAIIVNDIEQGVQIFDKSRPTCLATDWSKTGIGFWLLQKHCTCAKTIPFCCRTGWKVTLVGSRFTSSAESHYAPVEGEALAVADALDKARYFVLGCDNLTIAVDHKPLLKILGDRTLEDLPNPRLRRLKEKTLRYRFKVTHIPGVKHKAADGVSRYPSDESNSITSPTQKDIVQIPLISDLPYPPVNLMNTIRCFDPTDTVEDSTAADIAASLDNIRSVTWDKVRAATASDDTMRLLLDTVEQGMPESRHDLPTAIHDYHQFRDNLNTVDGIIIYKDRIVIPPALRHDVLTALHAAHQGTSSMTARAETSVFWPGITHDITNIRTSCQACNRMAPSQPSAPPIPPVPTIYPFQCICADYFHHKGRNYLVIVDRYTNWPIVEQASDGASGLIGVLRKHFSTYGIAEELASDGGPEFTASSTQKFLTSWGVHHRLSSVAFPHSNCRAEIGVKTVKRMIADNTGPRGEFEVDTFQRAILQYRNCPDTDTKLSPAECLFGRAIRDFIPVLPGRYHPHTTWRETLKLREEALRNRHVKAAERWSEHTKRLPPLIVGDRVRIQNQSGPHPIKWDKTGTVIEVRQYNQYVVKTDGSGRMTTRNRKFLRKFSPVVTPPSSITINRDLELLQSVKPHQALPSSHDMPSLTTASPVQPTVKESHTPQPDSKHATPPAPTRAHSDSGTLPTPETLTVQTPETLTVPTPETPTLRRSTRTRNKPQWYTAT
jgi:hypothetical protein